MNPLERATETAASHPGVALGYEPAEGHGGDGRLWIAAGGRHVHASGDLQRKRLISVVLNLNPDIGAKLVLLGADVGALGPDERTALRARVAFLPAAGGLLSSLNAWENIVLPLGFHHPGRLRGIASRVYDLVAGFSVEPRELLAKLPEQLTLYEKKLTGYVRILLEGPELLLVENLERGLDTEEGKMARRFPGAYAANCPAGTFVQLEDTAEA